jgi:Phytanoyl-CoA dioxygenase (PhyH)
MTFQRDGFQIFEGGLTSHAVTILTDLSYKHEAAVRASNRPWGEIGRFEEPTLNAIEVFTDPVKESILANTDYGWGRLTSSIAYPQLTYSFQTDEVGLALVQHVDGAADGPEEATECEILAGALLSSVASEADGAFVLWPASHISSRNYLLNHLQMPAWNAIRTIPKDSSRPQPFVGQIGDVILVHRLLQHGTATRSTPGVRRMAFIRLGFVWPPYAVNTPVGKTGFAR